MRPIDYKPVKIIEIANDITAAAGVRLLIRREDANHPKVSGNKWWKLRYNLISATQLNKKTLLTFGGAYSNMIYATAAAATEAGFDSIGIIRGEERVPLNHTLAFAKAAGMKLHFVSRDEYRKKKEPEFIASLKEKFGDFYLLPEGGTNDLAMKGCIDLGTKIAQDSDFDYLCLPVGTGGTITGIISSLGGAKKIVGFSSLKGGSFLTGEIQSLLHRCALPDPGNWSVETRFAFGGYGKTSPALDHFISEQKQMNGLPLDRVYTAKMVWGIFQMIGEGYFERGATVLALHTGGLQDNG
jgi:1-aminocyclopropane-1-carboxylate deaminase